MNDFAQKLKHQRYLDTLFVGTTKLCSAWVLAVLLGMVVALAVGAMPAIKHFGFHFFSSSDWDTNTEIFGALSPIFGSLFSSAIALLIAVPTSFGIAVFLTELCPRALRQPLGICIELLAGIPSIIYGMWGLFIFAPFFSTHIQPLLIEKLSPLPFIGALFKGAPMGIGIFTASVILAIMIIPYIASVMRDVFSVTPPMLKESAYGLGATTWEVVRYVVLPYTKTGVIDGIILGLGRALGETMAVTFVIGNTFNINSSLFKPGVSITSALANEFAESDGLHQSALLYLGLILFIITFIVLSLSKILLLRTQKH